MHGTKLNPKCVRGGGKRAQIIKVIAMQDCVTVNKVMRCILAYSNSKIPLRPCESVAKRVREKVAILGSMLTKDLG